MTRVEKIQAAWWLARDGMSVAAIGRAIDVHYSTAWGWLNPEARRQHIARSNQKRGAYKQAWANEHDRATCACGNKMGAGGHRRGDKECRACRIREENARTDERGREIVEMWAQGSTYPEIQARYGWTAGHLAAELGRLRAKGFDLPLRPPGGLRREQQETRA